MAPNAAPPQATPKQAPSARRITVSGLTPIDSLAQTDVMIGAPKPSFEVSGGLSVGEVRRIDPATRKRRKRPDEVDDDDLVPEADPTEALPPAALPAAFSSGVAYPYALDGSPLPLPPSATAPALAPALTPAPNAAQPSVAPAPAVPLAGGRVPGPQRPAPPAEAAVDLPDIEIDDDDMAKHRSRAPTVFFVLLLILNGFALLTAALNNGILHLGDLGGTLGAAFGGEAMELKAKGGGALPPPPAEALQPLGDDDDRADLRWMLSAPTLIKLTNGDLVLAVYGQAVNRDLFSFDEVFVEGTLHDANGQVLARSLPSPLMPLHTQDVTPRGMAARDALKAISAVYSRDTLPEAWPRRATEDPEGLKVPSGSTTGFVLVFQDINALPADGQALVEVSVQRARRASLSGGRP